MVLQTRALHWSITIENVAVPCSDGLPYPLPLITAPTGYPRRAQLETKPMASEREQNERAHFMCVYVQVLERQTLFIRLCVCSTSYSTMSTALER